MKAHISPARKTLWLLLVAFALFGIVMLSGCTTAIPLGESGRYGEIHASIRYVPPIDWSLGPDYLPDK